MKCLRKTLTHFGSSLFAVLLVIYCFLSLACKQVTTVVFAGCSTRVQVCWSCWRHNAAVTHSVRIFIPNFLCTVCDPIYCVGLCDMLCCIKA